MLEEKRLLDRNREFGTIADSVSGATPGSFDLQAILFMLRGGSRGSLRLHRSYAPAESALIRGT
jgi:hypothetical protein